MKKRKKVTWLFLTLCVILLACGCGQGTEEETTTTAQETTVATTEETTEETTPAPTEPPTREVAELKVGMIFYGEEGEGSLLTATLRQEMVEAATAIGMSEEQIMVQYNSREADWTQIEDSILACVDSGCQLIVGCAREYEAVIAAIAEEYPEVMFACVGSALYNGINSGTFTIDVAVAQYLCGAVAGRQTSTDRVGFVAAKDHNDVIVTEAVNAFAYGVWSTNQEAIVDVAILGKWFLPGAEAQGMSYLQSLGCDEMGSYTDLSIGALEYQWQQYFSMKLNQIIQKEVVGEAWSGDYYGGAVTCTMEEDLPEYVWGQLAQWGTMMEELPEETEELPEETEELPMETEELLEETEELSADESAEESTEETTEPYVIPEIEVDRDTGYLPNVQIHKIEWEE